MFLRHYDRERESPGTGGYTPGLPGFNPGDESRKSLFFGDEPGVGWA